MMVDEGELIIFDNANTFLGDNDVAFCQFLAVCEHDSFCPQHKTLEMICPFEHGDATLVLSKTYIGLILCVFLHVQQGFLQNGETKSHFCELVCSTNVF